MPRFLNAVIDCGCDPTGKSDTTHQLQACVNRAYGHTLPRTPVVLPPGSYLISDTIRLVQDNPSPLDHSRGNALISDGINVVPGRFLPHILLGQPTSGSATKRPVLVLAANAPGFEASSEAKFKPFVSLSSNHVSCHDIAAIWVAFF